MRLPVTSAAPLGSAAAGGEPAELQFASRPGLRLQQRPCNFTPQQLVYVTVGAPGAGPLQRRVPHAESLQRA